MISDDFTVECGARDQLKVLAAAGATLAAVGSVTGDRDLLNLGLIASTVGALGALSVGTGLRNETEGQP